MESDGKAYLGSIKASVKTPDFTVRGKKNIAEFRRRMRVAHEAGIDKGVETLSSILRGKKYLDTGTLADSVARRLFIKSSDVFSGDVHFNEPGKEYAYFVEHGRGPGFPPPFKKMVSWGKRKGLTFEHTMAIRTKIGLAGTKPRPFMDKAERRIVANYNKIVEKAVEKFRKSII